MLQQNGYPTKTVRNVIRKAINRNQKPDAKLHPNQQQSTKHCVFFKLQFIDRISMQIEKEIHEFLCPYDINLIMSHRNQCRCTPTSGPPQSKRKSPCAQVISL